MDIGLAVLRALIGLVLLAHASQKGLGWFSGPGLEGATAIFTKLGQRPARTMVLVAIVCESLGGLLLLTGFATPLGAAICAGTMLVAGASMGRLSGQFWNAAGGGEYPYVLAIASGALAFTGPGAFSLDSALGLPWHDTTASTAAAIGGAAVLVALVAAIPPLARRAPAHNSPAGAA